MSSENVGVEVGMNKFHTHPKFHRVLERLPGLVSCNRNFPDKQFTFMVEDQ